MSTKNLKYSWLFLLFAATLIFTFAGFPTPGRAALILEGQLFEQGEPVAVGEPVAMTIRIYDDEFNGTLLYEESQEIKAKARFSAFTFEEGQVEVKKRFSGTPAATLWIEIEYEGRIMTPRLNLGEIGSLNDLSAENSTIREAHLRTGGTATLIIDNDGVTLGGLLDMGGNSIQLGNDPRNQWPSSSQVSDLEDRIAVLENLLQHFSRNGNEITISGANLHIVNGNSSNATSSLNGLGNLIVGYNETRSTGNNRSGSHNIVVGKKHNYTSYGGLVTGFYNTISGAYACVSGGYSNTAGGGYSSVSGGTNNAASGQYSSVSGGNTNTASGNSASVSGGEANTASVWYSSVSGGDSNLASGNSASISGGNNNTAGGTNSSISGGRYNQASGYCSSIVGGGSTSSSNFNIASADYSAILGGHNNKVNNNNFACISGGYNNTASGSYSSVSGGSNNEASGDQSSVSGGHNNEASGDSASVSGGDGNTASSQYEYAPCP